MHREILMELEQKVIAQKFIENLKTDEQLRLKNKIFGRSIAN